MKLIYNLRYEPRAIHQRDDDCYIGSKDGRVTRFRFTGNRWMPSGEQSLAREHAVQAIESDAETGVLYVGMSNGKVLLIGADMTGGATTFHEGSGEVPVADITLTQSAVWILQRTSLNVYHKGGPARCLPLRHAASWIFRRDDDSVLIVCDNGVVFQASPYKIQRTVELQHMPLLVERLPDGGLVVGDYHGVYLYETKRWTSTTIFSHQPTLIRCVDYGLEQKIVLGVRGGKLFAATLPPAGDKRKGWAPRWERWEAFPSDVMAFAVPRSAVWPLVALRNHEMLERYPDGQSRDPGAVAPRSSPARGAEEIRKLVEWAGLERDIAVIRRGARELCEQVLRASRTKRDGSWMPLVRLVRAVDGYSDGSAAYYEKERGLGDLVAINAKERPLDALIYGARLHERRYDVISEVEVEVGESIHRMTALADGALVVSLRAGGYRVVTRNPFGVPEIDGHAPGGGDTRVLALHDGALHAWPKKADSARSVALGASLPTLHEHYLPDKYRVYAASPLSGGRWALGIYTEKGPAVRVGAQTFLLDEPTATSASGVGARRVRVLLEISDTCMVAGTDAGAIYFVKHGGTAPVVHVKHAVLNSSAIWRGALVRPDPEGAPRLCIGTATGEVLIFSVEQPDEPAPTLRLRARDQLSAMIKGLCALELDGQHVFVVATADGGVAVYAMPRKEPETTPYPDDGPLRRFPLLDRASGRLAFPGMRMLHVHAVHGQVKAMTALPVEHGRPRVAIAYRSAADRSDRIRIVELYPRNVERLDALTKDTARSVARWLDEIGIFDLPLPALLSALPFPGPEVRAVAARIRIADLPDDADPLRVLRDALEQATLRYPSQRAEFKSILDAIRQRMRGADGAWNGVAWFRVAFQVVPEYRGWGDERCRAAAVRKLLCPTALLADRHGGAGELEHGLTQFLEDSSPLVRLETLQALADTLHLIRREGIAARCFPGAGGERLAAAAPILRPVARFIAANPPPSPRGAEVSPQIWTALVVVRHLMLAFPEAVWVLCDHLSVTGVSWEAMSILAELLAGEAGEFAAARAKFHAYLPWVQRRTVTPREAVRFLAERYREPLQDESPDAEFDRARVPRYQWFLRGFKLGTMAEMLAHLETGEQEPTSPIVPWLSRIERERERFFQITRRWQVTIAARFAELREGVREHGKIAGHLQDESLLETLLEPERSIASAMFAAWQGALVRSQLLPDDVIGGTVVTSLRARSPWLVDGNRIDDGSDVVVRFSAVADHRRPELLRRWRLIQEISDSGDDGKHLPRILEVVERQWGAAMIMRDAGRNTADVCSDATLLAPIARGIATALLALQRCDLYHGAVGLTNIVLDGRHPTLVDYSRAGGPHENHAQLDIPYATGEDNDFRWWQVRRRPLRSLQCGIQGDVLGLARALGAFDPSKKTTSSTSVEDRLSSEATEILKLARAINAGAVADTFLQVRRMKAGAVAEASPQARHGDHEHPFVKLVESTLLAPSAGPVRVFVSYTRHDEWSRSFVARVKQLNQAPGIQVFIDDAIEPSDVWRERIETSLIDADVIVLCVSSHYFCNPFIRDVESKIIVGRLDWSFRPKVLLIPVDVVADPGLIPSPLESTQFVWPLDNPVSRRKKAERKRCIEEALSRVLQAVNRVAGQDP